MRRHQTVGKKYSWNAHQLSVLSKRLNMVSVTVAGCHAQCVLLLVLLATCRGSSSPLHSAGDTETKTYQCTPRQAQLQALLFKQFDESTHLFSACPSQLWLDVYHRESTLPVNGPALLLHPRSHSLRSS